MIPVRVALTRFEQSIAAAFGCRTFGYCGIEKAGTATSILILFDIDGTLFEVGDPFHGRSLLDAVRQVYGFEPDLDGIPRAGMLDAQILRMLLEKHQIDRDEIEAGLGTVMDAMGRLYEAAIQGFAYEQRLLPGACESVDAVLSAGWTAGVLTGNASTVAVLKLRAVGLDHLAAIGAFGDSARERSQLVEAAHDEGERRTGTRFTPERTILVGDTPNDIIAAHESNARVIAVATGRYASDALATYQPDLILPSLRDPEAFIDAVRNLSGC